MSRRNPKFITYSLFLLAAFLLLFIRPSLVVPLKFAVVQTVLAPIRVVSVIFHEVKKIVTYHQTYQAYQDLKLEYALLTERVLGIDEIVRENNRLAQLLDFKRRQVFASIAANVVGRDSTNWNSMLVVDRGRQDGVDVGMPVVSALGVVGKVAEVGETKAKVVLLTDPGFSVVGTVKRSREVGLISGTLQSKNRMRYLAPEADVENGDVVITSKLSSSFPEGLVIGQVIDVRIDNNSLTVDCLIEPAVAVSQLEEVLILHRQ